MGDTITRFLSSRVRNWIGWKSALIGAAGLRVRVELNEKKCLETGVPAPK